LALPEKKLEKIKGLNQQGAKGSKPRSRWGEFLSKTEGVRKGSRKRKNKERGQKSSLETGAFCKKEKSAFLEQPVVAKAVVKKEKVAHTRGKNIEVRRKRV